MGVITSAQYHWDRAALFRRHAEHARFPETREMYLRLARTEVAMAELEQLRHQSELGWGPIKRLLTVAES
jgi:hypothetical protein